MRPLQIAGQMQATSRRADGSVTLRFISAKEIDNETFAHIDSYYLHEGWVMFKPNEFKNSDVPKEDTETDDKPLWQRQQKTIYKLFMLRGGKPAEFGAFYRKQMSAIQETLGNAIEAEEGKHAR